MGRSMGDQTTTTPVPDPDRHLTLERGNMVDRTEELISQLRELDAQRVAIMQELKKLRMDHHARIMGALHAGRAPWETQTPE